jgi:hypothetical protein
VHGGLERTLDFQLLCEAELKQKIP